jgi:hypothetical protein
VSIAQRERRNSISNLMKKFSGYDIVLEETDETRLLVYFFKLHYSKSMTSCMGRNEKGIDRNFTAS